MKILQLTRLSWCKVSPKIGGNQITLAELIYKGEEKGGDFLNWEIETKANNNNIKKAAADSLELYEKLANTEQLQWDDWWPVVFVLSKPV